MVPEKWDWRAALVLGAGLLMPTTVHADPACDYRGTYSCSRYLCPTLWKVFHGPRLSRHAGEQYPNIQPDVEAGSYIFRSHCPYGDPRTHYDYPRLARSLGLSSVPASGPAGPPQIPAEPIPAPKPAEDAGKSP